MSTKELLQENRSRGWASVSDSVPAWVRSQIIAFRAHAELGLLRQTVLELSATVQGLLDANKRSAEYVEFLKAKVAARSKQ